MRSYIFIATLLGALSATSAMADQLTCSNISIPLAGIPEDSNITITLSPDDLIAQCTSSSGSALTLVSPENGISVTPAFGDTVVTTFTVKDAQGNEASATVTITRT